MLRWRGYSEVLPSIQTSREGTSQELLGQNMMLSLPGTVTKRNFIKFSRSVQLSGKGQNGPHRIGDGAHPRIFIGSGFNFDSA